jgi:hypothetical protein
MFFQSELLAMRRSAPISTGCFARGQFRSPHRSEGERLSKQINKMCAANGIRIAKNA